MHSTPRILFVAALAMWGCGVDTIHVAGPDAGRAETTSDDAGTIDAGRESAVDGGDGSRCNGFDDDGDRLVDEPDEGCVCSSGQSQACYPAPPGTMVRGACRRGSSRCEGNELGAWGACVGAVEPVTERCNGLDDDCDGQTDEELATVSCGRGACARTVACVAGSQVCTPGAATTEVCDGLDNDCDGQVDEALAPITCGAGACLRQVVACVGGVAQRCTPGTPATEVCDGVDNDCDGQTDEGFAALTCGQGLCARTVPACVNGATQTCRPGLPSAEVCDRKDNDCNGQVDDLPGGCTVVDVAVNISGDCVTAQCPAATPYPVGCSITMQGGDSRGCAASTPTSSTVFFKEGDECGVGRVSGTLKCANHPGSGLNAANCAINKSQVFYPANASGCP